MLSHLKWAIFFVFINSFNVRSHIMYLWQSIKIPQKSHKTWRQWPRSQRNRPGTSQSCHSCWRPPGTPRRQSPGLWWSLRQRSDWWFWSSDYSFWNHNIHLFHSNQTLLHTSFSLWLVRKVREPRKVPCYKLFGNCKTQTLVSARNYIEDIIRPNKV